MSPPEKPIFKKDQHIKYWLRCLKTYLPTQYTSNDSQRITLAFFILSALDLLGALHERTTDADRIAYADWIYMCQHPDGGFRGFTGADLREKRNEGNGCWDPANLAATYFALAALAVLGDSMERVRKTECWEWVRRLQLKDGSFGEALGRGDDIEGGRDIRFCYLAAAVRWILRLSGDEVLTKVEDIDVEALADFITSSQSYEGGIGKAPFHEAHAGWTYCGIGALTLLGRLPGVWDKRGISSASKAGLNSSFLDAVIRWLVYRQTSSEEEDFHVRADDFPSPVLNYRTPSYHVSIDDALIDHASNVIQGSSYNPPGDSCPIAPIISPQTPPCLEPLSERLQVAGFSGRSNKVSDTCYSFWVGGTLAILQKVHVFDYTANRNYLLSETQHLIGGFGKYSGDPPDILHSYLGLAALAVMREAELRSLDPILCISINAREGLENSALGNRMGKVEG